MFKNKKLTTYTIFLAASAMLAVSGCNFYYTRGVSLEAQSRWEEAAIQYHLAVIQDPEEEEYREALKRANQVVAKENMALYRNYLARKEFRKAYHRLEDASRQDPQLSEVKEEQKKWLRVLVAGQVEFEFEGLRANLNLADEIELTIRINTPNPGEVISSEVDLATGTFYVENLLYDRPGELLTYYSLNAIGVNMTYARSRIRKFTQREFLRFVNFRTPVIDAQKGKIRLGKDGDPIMVTTHRPTANKIADQKEFWFPGKIPHYSLSVAGENIRVSSPQDPGIYTPRFLYINEPDRRMFVDFGRYKIKNGNNGRWGAKRLPLTGKDYFPTFSRNIALQPYFFYRGDVFSYVVDKQG